MIYHYTTAEGIKGIIDNKEIFLTESSFMNDPKEILYGNNFLKEKIDDFAKENNHDYDEIKNELINYIDGASYFQYTFIFSCSKEYDSLVMWSMYGKNDGYCLKIDEEELLKIFENNNKNNVRFIGEFDTIYNDKDKENNTTRIIKEYFEKSDISKNAFDSYLLRNKLFLPCIFGYKHNCFKNESEKRYLFQINKLKNKIENIGFTENIKYRVKNGEIIPSLSIQLNNLDFIKGIKMSPLNNSINAKKGLELFLLKNNINIEVESNDLPFKK